MSPAPALIRAIHTAKSRQKIDEATYREILADRFQVVSSKDLSDEQARDFLDMVNGGARPSASTASGEFAPILRALWIAAHNLAIVTCRDDHALIAFCERQTGLAHTRFLKDPRDAHKVIEALKSWLAREGGVDWPKKQSTLKERKRAIARAIAKKLHERGDFGECPFPFAWATAVENLGRAAGLPTFLADYTPQNFDALSNLLGAKLRGEA